MGAVRQFCLCIALYTPLAVAGCASQQTSDTASASPRSPAEHAPAAHSTATSLGRSPASTPQNDGSFASDTEAALPGADTPNAPTSARRLRLGDPALSETSGLAVSPSGDGIVWAINDSGNEAALFAFAADGSALGRFAIDADNRDWEALDSGFVDGVASLLIGDTGDNLRRHDSAALLLVAEPDALSAPGDNSAVALPARRIEFRFSDGPRNVEAMALDGLVVWMLDKPPMAVGGTRVASGLYRLELAAALAGTAGAPVIAMRVATFLAPVGGLKAQLAATLAGIDLGYPTELDLDAPRGHAWVLTYRDVLRYDRVGNEPWPATLSRQPALVRAHGLAQAEAMTVLGDGSVRVTSEGVNPRLLRIAAP